MTTLLLKFWRLTPISSRGSKYLERLKSILGEIEVISSKTITQVYTNLFTLVYLSKED